MTTSAGMPLEVRDTVALNTDVFNNEFFYDLQSSVDHQRIPERIVHTKGTGAFGYFEVTNDVSKYTKAEVFNGIGKKTKVVTRFAVQLQNTGGSDIVRETDSLVVKFYTNEGNFDLLCFNFPVYLYRDPNVFTITIHSSGRNPKTNLFDRTNVFEYFGYTPDSIHMLLWLLSDYGIPNGYRKMDAFPIQTYEVTNKHGESSFVRFNFRTEQGIELLSSSAARTLRAIDPDYSVRDLYNAIARGDFPAWRMEMDVISKSDIQKLDYNPFDVTRMWKNGTYHTVTIGRLVLNRNPDNFFKDVEQAAYNPGNLVPGIPGPRDVMFRARRFAYRDAQNYRLGINHNKIQVNCPLHSKVYSRDGVPPVLDNMRDAPNYYQNSFHGPAPFVDVARPKESLLIYDRNAVDLQPSADFYNTFVTTEDHRIRMAENIALGILNIPELVQNRTLGILFLVDRDLGTRTTVVLAALKLGRAALTPALTVVGQTPRTLGLAQNVGNAT